VGGPHWSPAAAADLASFAALQQVPVALGFRRQDYLDNRHPNYAGDLNVGPNPRLAQRLRDADALLVIGSRLGDIETQGYTNLDPASLGKRLIHVHADADELGRVYQPDLAIEARAPEFVAALAASLGVDSFIWQAVIWALVSLALLVTLRRWMLKKLRLREHLEWAAAHGALAAIDTYLRGLREDQWHHIDD